MLHLLCSLVGFNIRDDGVESLFDFLSSFYRGVLLFILLFTPTPIFFFDKKPVGMTHGRTIRRVGCLKQVCAELSFPALNSLLVKQERDRLPTRARRSVSQGLRGKSTDIITRSGEQSKDCRYYIYLSPAKKPNSASMS